MEESRPVQTWSNAVLGSLSHLTTTYARIVVVLALATAVLAAFYTARHLELITGRNDLISPDKRYLQLDEEYSETFRGLEQLIVVAEGPDFEETKAFVRRLGQRLEADREQVEEVFYRIDTSSLQGKKLLFLPPEDLHSLRENVEEYQELMRDLTAAPALNTLFTAINRKVSSVMVSHLAADFLGLEEPESEDEGEEGTPLKLSFLKSLLQQMDSALASSTFHYRSPWDEFFGNDELANDGFLASDDKRFVFLQVEPRKRGEGFNARQESIAAVRRYVAELRKEFPHVQAGVTGSKALDNDEMLAAQEDTRVATLVSLTGVTLLYVLFFHKIRRPLIIAFALTVGLIWTMGVLTLTVGHLSIISIFVAPMLIGLADDFGVHFVTRYEEERDLGKPFGRALRATFISTVPGIVAGACTTALAFYAMMFADFRGIQELGLIAGNGMLLSLLAMLTLLPALLTLTEGKKKWRKRFRRETRLARGFASWGFAVQRFCRPGLILAAGVSLVCLLALPTITFDYNLLNLQARGTESVTWELRIIENSERSSRNALSTASSLAEAARKAALFEALPSVETVETISSLVPEQQEERIRLVRKLAPFFNDLPSTLAAPGQIDTKDLKFTLDRLKFKLREKNDAWNPKKKPPEQEIAEVRGLLISVLSHLQTLSASEAEAALDRLQKPLFHDFADKWSLLCDNLNPPGPITLADIPTQLARRFVSADEKKFLLQIYPRKNIWNREPLAEFISQLRQVDPDVTGSPVIGYESIRAIKDGYVEGGLYATAAILLVTFLTLRRVKDTLLAMVPVVLGMLWTGGLMWLCDLKLNLANLVAVPLIIGIGIENGIHLVHRSREEACEGWVLVAGSTGQSVTLFSLTTMVGFGSLMVAKYYGIFSMGLLLTLAVGSVLLASLTVLPLLLHTPAAKMAPARETIPEEVETALPARAKAEKRA